MNTKYDVYINGELVHRVNKNLVVRQSVSDEELEQIIKLHIRRYEIIEQMKALNSLDENLAVLAEIMIEIEFKLQDLWHFKRDMSMHQFYTLPHCRCPSHDNQERSGTGQLIINPDCPLHKSYFTF